MKNQKESILTSSNRIKCLYCTNEFKEGKGSLEHVILSSLGGRKASRNICCVECNTRLGIEIDKSVADSFSFFSNMLGIKTGRNKATAVIKNVLQIEDKSYDMLPSGKIELAKNDVSIEEIDKHKKILINAKDEEQAKNILKNIMFNQLKIDPESVKNLESTINKIYPPVIHSKFLFGNEEHYRSFAKTILTYLATLVKPERLRENSFNDVINYINGIVKDNKYPILYNGTLSLPLEPKLSNINHRVFIHASTSKNKVIGIFEIFGHIKVSCILSNEWKYKDVSKVYVIDPVTAEVLNQDITFSDVLINECINMKTIIDDESINYFRDDLSKLAGEIAKRQINTRNEELINIAMEKYLPQEGEAITKEAVFELFNYLMNEFNHDIHRIDRKETYKFNLEDLQ